MLDEYLEIDTPENIAFGYPLAGIGSRFIAALVDTTLILLLQAIVIVLGILLTGMFFADASASLFDPGGLLLGIIGLISFAFLWGYYIFFELLWNGQSPGKRLTGLRVIRSDGSPISLAESTIRNLIRFIDFLPLFYAAGVLTMFIDGKDRRLGDLAAGTLVVREQGRALRIEDLAPAAAKPDALPFSLIKIGDLPLEKLTEEDLDLVRRFLKRRPNISNARTIEDRILERLFERMDRPVPRLWDHQRVDLLQFLAAQHGSHLRSTAADSPKPGENQELPHPQAGSSPDSYRQS